MKRIALLSLLVLGAVGLGKVQAQEPYKGRIAYEDFTSKRQVSNDRVSAVTIGYTMDLSGMALRSTQQVCVTPMLVSRNGADTLLLGRFWVVGANRERSIRRHVALNPSDDTYGDLSRVIRRFNGKSQRLTFSQTVDYKPWMGSSRVVVGETVTGCAGCNDGEHISQLVASLLPAEYTPKYATEYLQPVAEEVKHRAERMEAFFNYKQGRYELLRDYKNNAAELKRVDDFVRNILNDKNLKVSDFLVSGYASPEGKYQSNIMLSKNRAMTFATYLKQEYQIESTKIKSDWFGEDWKGLAKLVEASELANKKTLLEIINRDATDIVREAALSKLDGGKTFNLLLNEYYPKLRRNICSVSYVVKSFTLQEARQIYLTKPAQLSLQEFFQVANSYEKGSDDFMKVFRTALQFFPEDKVANLNCGAAELEAGRPAEALNFLMKAGDMPETLNNIGVALAKQKKFDQADVYFDRATAAGDKSATKNKSEAQQVRETLGN